MKQYQLELVHVGGERKTVPILYATGTRLGFKWGMAGNYELVLNSNYVMRAKLWSALDIKAAKAIWMEMTGKTEEDLLEARFFRHMKSMPR